MQQNANYLLHSTNIRLYICLILKRTGKFINSKKQAYDILFPCIVGIYHLFESLHMLHLATSIVVALLALESRIQIQI